MEIELTPEEQYQADYNSAWESTDEPTSNEVALGEEEVTEEEIVDSSDSDEALEDTVDEEPSEEVVEEDSEQHTEDSTDNVEQPEDDSDEKPTMQKVLVNGQEIELNNEELILMAQRGFDYTKKTQELSEWRKSIESMKNNNISEQDLAVLADIKNGNKEALALLAKQANIDVMDAEFDEKYKPTVDNTNYELNDVLDEINRDADVANTMSNYVSTLPSSVSKLFQSNPNVLRGFAVDVKNGVAQKIMPEVVKQLAINPSADFVTLYQSVGSQVLGSNEEVVQEVEKPKPVSRDDKKKVVAPKKSVAKKKSYISDADAIWNDDDKFNEIQKRLRGY